MRAFVFTDKSLARHAGRYVWLAIDTEKAKNAPFRRKFPVPALPSFFVVDPTDQTVVVRWVGGMTVPQVHAMLDDARLAFDRKHGRTPGTELDAALARADSLYGAGQDSLAADAYEAVLAQAPDEWPRYARTVESLLFALDHVGRSERCATLARDAYVRLARTPSAANVAASGLSCALALPADNPRRPDLVTALETDARDVLADTSLAIAADDRSGLFGTLIDARSDAGDSLGARQLTEEWAAFLEHAAARAHSPDARAVFDSHRLSAYIDLGRPERAIPMLQASERDLPNDYNPPARLALAYKAMKRWDDALAASDRALAKAYGPRKLGILQTRADIYVGRGDRDAARRTLEEALAIAEALPPGQRSESTIATLKKKLEAFKQPPASSGGEGR
jgi:tetratricopeptide (TPR) repeat protein